MADPRDVEKEWENNDPIVGANTTAQDEPIAEPGDSDKGSQNIAEKGSNDNVNVTSYHEDQPITVPKKGWTYWINPLKWNPPAVPNERGPSREPTSNWLSRLTFSWVSPILWVNHPSHG